MIVEALITGLLSVVGWVIGLLPAGSPWAPDLSPVSGILDRVAGLNTYFPITEAIALIAIAVVINNANVLWRMFNWLWRTVKP